MPIYNEVWEEEDFMFRNMINLQTKTKLKIYLQFEKISFFQYIILWYFFCLINQINLNIPLIQQFILTVQTLTKNHVKLLDNLKFEFVEYKANQLLACHLYDRMAQHCKNQFGLFEDSYVPECLDARNYFQLCVRMNASYGLAKKYFPEYFLTNEYSRPNPNFKELGL